MIGKIIGAFVGEKVAKRTSSMGGASGAALGVIATTVLRRMSLPAMIALGAGGYVVKKIVDKQKTVETPPEAPEQAKANDNIASIPTAA